MSHFGLCVLVVHNDMDFPVRMGIDYAVHKIQKLYPSTPLVMPSYNMTGGRFQHREEGGSAMARVFMREASHRPTIGQFQIALSALQRLDVMFQCGYQPLPSSL